MKMLRGLFVIGYFAAMLAAYPSDSLAQTRAWGTYIGGSKSEHGGKVAADSFGFTYVAGKTASTNGISTIGSFDPVLESATEAYIAKFNPVGQRVWATYYGKGSYTEALDVKLDLSGNVYVLGNVYCSSEGLATPGAHDPVCDGPMDMFIVKFSPGGQRLWGTYFGGNDEEHAHGLSVTPSGIYVIGLTTSPQDVVPLPSQDASLGGSVDAVVAKFDQKGKMLWSRYFGGDESDNGRGIACKQAAFLSLPDVCYITGVTKSIRQIASSNAHDAMLDGEADAFLAQLNGSNGEVTWSTYYGGEKYDTGMSLVIDNGFNAYLGGVTLSNKDIATPNAHDTMFNGGGGGVITGDMFIAKFNVHGIRQVATYFGNQGDDQLLDLAIDTSNNVYVLGVTSEAGKVVTLNAFDTIYGGGWPTGDAVLAKFNQGLMRIWGTYYGGNGAEYGSMAFVSYGGVAVDAANRIYVTGDTNSTDGFASTPGSHQPVKSGLTDGFLVKFSQ